MTLDARAPIAVDAEIPERLQTLQRVTARDLEPGDICMEYVGKLSFRKIETAPTLITVKNLLLSRLGGLRNAVGLQRPEVRSSMRVLHTCIVLKGTESHSLADLRVGSMTSKGNGERPLVSFDSSFLMVFRLRNPSLRRIFVRLATTWSHPPYRIKFSVRNHTALRSLSFGPTALRELSMLADLGPSNEHPGMHCSEFVCSVGALSAGLLRCEATNESLATSLKELARVPVGYPGWPFLIHPRNVHATNLCQRFVRDKVNVELLGFAINARKPNTLRRCFFS